jgi:hypothetical protein
MELSQQKKKVRVTLLGLNGNAFVLLGAFQRAAREQGWSAEDVSAVVAEATKGDYDHLLRVLVQNSEEP